MTDETVIIQPQALCMDNAALYIHDVQCNKPCVNVKVWL